jgi:hypothetical protein
VSLGARSAEAFEKASARLGMAVDNWDYATLRDEA